MGRRWGVGADEFALPSLCSMALRVMWSVALVVMLVSDGTKITTRTLLSPLCLVCHDTKSWWWWHRGDGKMSEGAVFSRANVEVERRQGC